MHRVALGLALLLSMQIASSITGPALAGSKEDKKLTEEYWETKGFKDRFSLGFAIGRTELDATIQVNSTAVGLGTSINVESLLGLDSRDLFPGFKGYYRFSRKSAIRFAVSEYDRDGAQVTDEDIQYGDVFIPAGTFVAASADYNFLVAAYAYSLVNNGKIEAGLTAGLTAIGIDTALITSGLPNDIRASEDITLPLPVLGVYTSVTLRPKLVFSYRGSLFLLDYDRYSGSFLDLELELQWYPFKHVGFTAGIQNLSLDVQVEGKSGDFDGQVGLDFRRFDIGLRIIF